MMKNKTHQRRKERGLCVECGKEKAIEGKTLCHACKAKAQERDKTRYHWYKEHGICTKCGQEKALPGLSRCLVCNMDAREREKARYNKLDEDKKQANRERSAARRQRLSDSGFCWICGKRPVQEGRKSCSICLAKGRERSRQKRLEAGVLPRTMRGDGEHCSLCGKPGCNGEKLCPECRQRCIDNLPKNHDNTNHIWRKKASADVARIEYNHRKGQNNEAKP